MEELDFSGLDEFMNGSAKEKTTMPNEELDFSGIENFIPQVEAQQFTGEVSPQGIPLKAGENVQQVEKDRTAGEIVGGVAETGLAMGTASTGGLAGHVAGFFKGLYDELKSGEFGSKEAAERIKKKSEEFASALTYHPRGEAGQEYLQTTAETLQPLEAITPLMPEISAAMGAAMPKTPKVVTPTAAERGMLEATKRGIPVLKSDISPPKTFVGKTIQQTGERIPIAGTGGIRSKQQLARVQAIKDTLSEFGDDVIRENVDDVAKSLTQARGNKIKRFSTLKNDVISKLSTKNVEMPKTLNMIDEQVAKLRQINTESSLAAAKKLEAYKQSFSNQTLENIELVRKDLGKMFEADDLVSVRDIGNKAVKSIYASLNEDMGSFIKANGEPKDFNKWTIANRELSNLMGELKNSTFKNVLNKGEVEPEAVNRLLFSQKPSQIKILYRNLDAKGKQNAKVAILNKALEKSGGIDNISPAKFKQQINNLSKPIGVFFEGKDRDLINGLSEALAVTKRADEFAVSPPTGVQNTMTLGAMAATDILGGMGAATIGGGVAGYAARLYETIPIKRALRRLGQAKRGTPAYEKAAESLLIEIYSLRSSQQGKQNERTGNK